MMLISSLYSFAFLLHFRVASALPTTSNTTTATNRNDHSTFWFNIGLYGAWVNRDYRSSSHQSPELSFVRQESCDDSLTFISPRGPSVPAPGPIILDAQGDLIWMETKWGQAMDFRVQSYKGEDYLTFWTGIDRGTFGSGTYYMLNSSYDIVYEINAHESLGGDLHEFNIIDDRAIFSVYTPVQVDLSSIGGRKGGWIYDSGFQEIDIETGDLLFEWRASEHLDVLDTFRPLNGRGNHRADSFDIFHINSIDKDDSGNYIISFRHTHSLVCINPRGEQVWVLGGKNNQFMDISGGAATNFTWQHHARWHPGNIITVFDNGAFDNKIWTAEHSRGLKISLDLEYMETELLQDYVNPTPILAQSQGSVQILPSGNVFVGWGYAAAFTEFTPDGTAVCEAHFGASVLFDSGLVKSYRNYKYDWVGRPSWSPSIAIKKGLYQDQVFVSWNGATEVRYWKLESIEAEDRPRRRDSGPAIILPKQGFETTFTLKRGQYSHVRVIALDTDHAELGSTDITDVVTGLKVTDRDRVFDLENESSVPLPKVMGWFIILMFIATAFGLCSRRVLRQPSWRVPKTLGRGGEFKY